MTKAKTKAEKRRFKKLAQIGLPELADAPRKLKRGRARMDEIKSEPEAERTVLEARARQAGKQPKDLNEMRDPAYGEAAGVAILAIHGGDTAKRLWAAYRGFTAAEATYAKYYLGLSLHAQTAKLEMMPERLETRPDDRPDLRTEEERSRDASNNWMRWQGLIMHLPCHQQAAIYDVAYGRVEPMSQGKVTDHGRRFVVAMEAFANVLDQQ